MLQPARRKYRKEQKGRNKGVATVGAKVSFGEYGLKAVGRGRLARGNDRARPGRMAVAVLSLALALLAGYLVRRLVSH